jgi:PAS domain S-box-containing protein
MVDRHAPWLDGSVPGAPLRSILTAALLAVASAPASAADQPSTPPAPASLTPEERAWLTAHGPLRFAPDPAFPPIEWFDEGGHYRGMVADYFELIEARLGTRIEIVRVPSWAEALRRARTREVDGLTAAQITPERGAYLDWTPPIVDIANVVIVRAGAGPFLSLETLGGRRVAVTGDNAIHEYLRTRYPTIEVIRLKDDLACLIAVSFGRVDAAVINLAVASYLIEQHGIGNLRIAADSGRTNPLAIATRSDQPLLRSIMAKGLAAVTPAERRAIQGRWLHLQGGHFVSKLALVGWAAAVLAALGLTAMLAVVWNRTLRRRVARATTELEQELRERQRIEAALRRSEGKLALHLDQTLVGVIELDRDFQIAYWNPAAERIFGWSRGEVTGKVAEFLLPADLRPALLAQWRQLMAGTGGWHSVNANLMRDGTPITCEWFNTALADDAGHVHGVMSMVLDVSERARREEAQARAQRLESLAVLAGGIAHDFNNLLTGILGNVSLLLEGGRPGAEQAELLEEAEAAARRAQALTRQLLTFARGGAPVKALLDLGPLVRQSALFATRGAAGSCRVDVPEGLWPVEADAGQLGQVVQNLVLNALEARPDGLVELSLANVQREPPARPAGPCVRLSVSDQGPGIPSDRLQRIFDPFYSTKERGTGLGLAVTHSIMARHGGLVEVRSSAGQGTTFDLFLPAQPDRIVVSSPPRSPAPAMRLRVLIMDDDEAIQRVARRTLGQAGCEIEVAADGEQAVARWRAARAAGRSFDLVVLDLTVPGGMGGQETLATLRALDPDVRAIVSSGYSHSEVLADYRAHGFTAAISKPWSADELRRVVAAVGHRPAPRPA